jgi:hypothetical protein
MIVSLGMVSIIMEYMNPPTKTAGIVRLNIVMILVIIAGIIEFNSLFLTTVFSTSVKSLMNNHIFVPTLQKRVWYVNLVY